MAREPLNIFDVDGAYAAGGFFADGLYRIEQARFTYYDFNQPGKPRLCMSLALQAIVDGKDTGDVKMQYWGVMDQDKEGNKTVEPCSTVKGEKGFWSQIRLTENNKHDKLFGYSDFAIFMTNLKKVGKFDMDAAGNDITSLDGITAEFGKVADTSKPKVKTAVEEAEMTDEEKAAEKKKSDRGPREIIVVVDIPTKGKTDKKDKADKKEEKSEKTPAKSKKGSDEDTAEEIILEFLKEGVLTSDNEEGTPLFTHKMAMGTFLRKTKKFDADRTEAVMEVFNDSKQLSAILTSEGWELDGKVIKKSE